MATAAPAAASVRAGVLAAATVSLVTLSIATFELSMADWPSGFVLLVILPLASLLFFSCCLWSASQLLRIRKDGVRFAAPFLICALTLAALDLRAVAADLSATRISGRTAPTGKRSWRGSRTASCFPM